MIVSASRNPLVWRWSLLGLAIMLGVTLQAKPVPATDISAALTAIDQSAKRICRSGSSTLEAANKAPDDIHAALSGLTSQLARLVGNTIVLNPSTILPQLRQDAVHGDYLECKNKVFSRLYASALIAGLAEALVVPLHFLPVDAVPGSLKSRYEQLILDSETAGVDRPQFYLSIFKLRDDETGVSVKAVNSIACSADGQCGIDLFVRHGDDYRQIFSVIARNIGLIFQTSPASAEQYNYPVLVTNIPVKGDAEQPLALRLSQVGGVWRWNGHSYEIAH